jgi:exodeoxyribonuclease V alpha subunit
MSVLERLAAESEMSPLDLRFANMMERLADRTHADVIALTAALVSRERGKGHPCIELTRWAERPLSDIEDSPRLPAFAAWTSTLRASAVVGSGSPATPLVLDAAGRCYLHRYWDAERRVAERIRKLTDVRRSDTASIEAVSDLFRTLFPVPATGDQDADRQAWVAAAALRNRFTVVSGGPGTGKTTTIARVLALVLAQRETAHIALAAPTGKAAARLTESIREQARNLPVADSVRKRIAAMEARTIHRLLRYRGGGGFLHDAGRPLPCDLLVIDEASMVDLLLMDAVLAAIPAQARVILVGDKDQLASVEAGFVFGDCCEAAAQTPPSLEFADAFRMLSGRDLPTPAAASTGSLRDAGVELRLAWRFRHKPGIGTLADAVRRADPVMALAALSDDRLADVRRFDLPRDPSEIVAAIAPTFAAVADAASPDEALQCLARGRILCATNHGPWSVERLNVEVERMLELRKDAGEWYRGRPLLITRNDYSVGLFNGDVGVCLPDDEGRMRAWFAGPSGVRSLPPAKLPPHETAWAMTVHKSQGSEFEAVVLVLPRGDSSSSLVTRELVYTAVTRARTEVTVFADQESFSHAILRRAERASGLRELLAST